MVRYGTYEAAAGAPATYESSATGGSCGGTRVQQHLQPRRRWHWYSGLTDASPSSVRRNTCSPFSSRTTSRIPSLMRSCTAPSTSASHSLLILIMRAQGYAEIASETRRGLADNPPPLHGLTAQGKPTAPLMGTFVLRSAAKSALLETPCNLPGALLRIGPSRSYSRR